MATTITVRPATRPIRVTFDTRPYGSVTRPQLSKIITTGWPLTPDRLLSKKSAGRVVVHQMVYSAGADSRRNPGSGVRVGSFAECGSN